MPVKSFSSLSRHCVLVSLTFISGAHAGIVVNLGKVVIDLGPDGHAKREIEVANPDNRTADVTIFAADWKQDENGAVEAIDPSTNKTPDSATGWIGVNPQRFLLKKGEKKIVTVSLDTPKEPMGLKEYRSMVFAETTDERPAETTAPGREMRIRTISRIGTKIFVNNPATAVKLDCAVTKVAEETRDGKRGLEIQTANNGNVHIQSDNSNVVFAMRPANRLLRSRCRLSRFYRDKSVRSSSICRNRANQNWRKARNTTRSPCSIMAEAIS